MNSLDTFIRLQKCTRDRHWLRRERRVREATGTGTMAFGERYLIFGFINLYVSCILDE